MIQVIGPGGPRKPTTGQRLSAGLGQALETGQRLYEQHQAKKALEGMGIDPSILALPKEAQGAFFKQQFAPEKIMTPLQQSQMDLNQQKFRQAQEQEALFKRLQGQPEAQDESAQGAGSFDVGDLEQAAAFAGQPGQAGVIGNMAKAELEKRKAEEKRGFEEKKLFHTESKKFFDDLSSKAESAEVKNRALQRMIPNIHKIKKWDRIVSNVFGGTKWENLLKSTTAQEFDANTLPLLEGLRQTLGGVLSDSDIRLIMQKIVTASKDPEANEKIAKALMFENSIPIEKKKIADEIVKENKGYRPPNFSSLINERFNEQFGPEIQNVFSGLLTLPDDPENQKKFGMEQLSGEMIDVIGPDGQEGQIDRSQFDQLPAGWKLK